MDSEDIIRRAKIRHDYLMAKRERAEAIRREATSLKVDLRIFTAHVDQQADSFHRRLSELASRINAHLDELEQEQTPIVGLPALEPKDQKLAQTDRIYRPTRQG